CKPQCLHRPSTDRIACPRKPAAIGRYRYTGWTSVSKSRIWTELRSWRLPALRGSGPGNPQRPTFRPSDRGTGASLFNTNTGDPLSDHRFKVGQCVNYTSGPRHQRGSSGVYRITQLLPSEGAECLYRIKSTDESHEHVAKETELERAT